ncbi:MAG: thiamine pyrophosphate-binding protein, partial [Chloroflexota bacterium]
MPKQDAWQAVVEALKAEGVKYVYGIPGSPRHLYDALYDNPTIKAILVRHEAAGAFMAYAESRLTRRPAVCFASPGPGVTNLVAGILEA